MASVPQFNYYRTAWVNLKNRTANDIVNAWNSDIFRVLLLTDPQFSKNDMVLLCREQWEDLIESVMDLVSAEEYKRIKIPQKDEENKTTQKEEKDNSLN